MNFIIWSCDMIVRGEKNGMVEYNVKNLSTY